ncbi:hypothetical protein BDR04DRAFT_1017180 [Suillus decipiens]|nr:hypothetical protein BDR04DRAFT_1017180 [Suillus decipiens]
MDQACSDDTSHLKNFIVQYVAPDPPDKELEPPIYADPQLVGLLCPIKHAKYIMRTLKSIVQAELQNGVIRIHSAAWPAFMYEGTTLPGKDFNPDNVQEGFLKGYYLKQVSLVLPDQ